MGTFAVGVAAVLAAIGMVALVRYGWRNRYDWQKHDDPGTNLRYSYPSMWRFFPMPGGFHPDDEDEKSEPPKS